MFSLEQACASPGAVALPSADDRLFVTICERHPFVNAPSLPQLYVATVNKLFKPVMAGE